MYLHGRNVLKEILNMKNAVKIKRVMFTNQKNADGQINLLKEACYQQGFRVESASTERLAQLSKEKKHQGVVIEINKFPFTNLKKLRSTISKKSKSVIVLLDKINDPHNFGAIIRTAVAAGADGIIIPEKGSCSITSSVIKVSTGLAFRIPITIVTNISKTIDILKDDGFWFYAATMEGKPYYSEKYSEKSGIVFGSEAKGIRPLVDKKCDFKISIPMEINVDSLNVAASAAIIMFHVRRKLLYSGDSYDN
ncbi:MAG: 23S rRNA (guanosine(2251)-2'-O)-methyltransferase RlmB [Petrotogales bacterium]